MSISYTLSLLALAGLGIAVTVNLNRPASPRTAPPPVYPLRADPEAGRALENGIAALDPGKVQWLKTRLRQQIHAAPATLRVDGTCLVGPAQRVRLDLQVDLGGSRRALQIMRDARTCWRAEQGRSGSWEVTRVDLQRVQRALDDPNASASARAEFCQAHGLTGPGGMLQGLRSAVIFTRQDALRWRGKDVLLLTGARHQGCTTYEPRQCRLVLDAHTFWPHRLEWWGPNPEAAGDTLLMHVEYHEPVLNQPFPEQALAITVPGTPVIDLTEVWLEKLRGP